jgi:hypothetical protein
MLPVSLDCPFLIAPSVFSYVYFSEVQIIDFTPLTLPFLISILDIFSLIKYQ